ncbi:hypothetical protein ABK040_000184 [Willaertia magna]
MSDITKKLKIKVGSCTRCFKEYNSYQKELDRERERLEKLKQDNSEETRIKQQVTVVEETECMIPLTRTKLKQQVQELSNFLSQCEDIKESEEYKTATDLLSTIQEAKII